RVLSGTAMLTAMVLAEGSTPTQVSPNARPGRVPAPPRKTCTATYAPGPQLASTGTSMVVPFSGTIRLREASTLSDSTSNVASPANGGAIWMRTDCPTGTDLR